ncbi:MAG: helix-turn-helix domain-containing protein [Bacteroidetes bacterium]|nr:helix-turn-helix domain-containing protein [Bacteroidota bacterium]
MMTGEAEMLKREIAEVKDMIRGLAQKQVFDGIEEVSLSRAARMLHMGAAKIVKHVEQGRLKALTSRDSKHRKRYRFRLTDIREFQRSREAVQQEPSGFKAAQEIAHEIFGN